MIEERSIQVSSHGRYLVVAPTGLRAAHPAPILVGFHGYAEDAAVHLERLETIPGVERWILVSVQGLHRFYRGRSQDVVASWMTRQDREVMIADNIAYVSAVVEAVSKEWSVSRALVFAGFSQGVATAFRAATLGSHQSAGVLGLGGDVPPELDDARLARVSRVLIGRGQRDDWYSSAQFSSDETRLRAAGVDVTTHPFDGGHEWPADFSQAAGEFLSRFA
jgi:predicted esterase